MSARTYFTVVLNWAGSADNAIPGPFPTAAAADAAADEWLAELKAVTASYWVYRHEVAADNSEDIYDDATGRLIRRLAAPRPVRLSLPERFGQIYDLLDGIVTDHTYIADDLVDHVEELRDAINVTLNALREEVIR